MGEALHVVILPFSRTLSPDNEGMETNGADHRHVALDRRTLSPDNEGMETRKG